MTGYYGPAAGLPELFVALARATRYREAATVAVAVCPNDHTLVRVVDTEAGLVLVWERPGLAATDDSDADHLRTRRDSRQSVWALEVDGAPEQVVVEAECACRTTYLPAHDVIAAARAGRRRVVVVPTDVRRIAVVK